MQVKLCLGCSLEKPLSEFYKDSRNTSKLLSRCKSCHDEKARRWREANPERRREIERRYRAKHRLRLQRRWRQSRTGWSADDFEIAWARQKGLCAICSHEMVRDSNAKYGVHADHDHNTGRIRELLCGKCNRGIGQFEDDPEILDKAARYLRRHTPKLRLVSNG